MIRHRFVVFAVLALAACSSSPEGGGSDSREKVSNLQVVEPAEVHDGADRAAVRVEVAETVLEIAGMEFSCKGYRGWLGRLGAHAGSIRVGNLQFVYQREGVRIFAKKGVWAVPREEGRRFFVEQNGEFGRNLFK